MKFLIDEIYVHWIVNEWGLMAIVFVSMGVHVVKVKNFKMNSWTTKYLCNMKDIAHLPLVLSNFWNLVIRFFFFCFKKKHSLIMEYIITVWHCLIRFTPLLLWFCNWNSATIQSAISFTIAYQIFFFNCFIQHWLVDKFEVSSLFLVLVSCNQWNPFYSPIILFDLHNLS